jgi:transcriptional regulator with XRE-family HTH domain
MADAEGVRKAIGDNVERIRGRRGLSVRQFSARLKELGLSLSASGVSDIENAARKVSADELLIFAIALNTSVIDLLTPEDGKPLQVADGVEPMAAGWLELWLSGDTPWPPDPADAAYTDQFFETASDSRKLKHRTDMRPEMQEISALKSAVAGAIVGPGTWINQTDDPEVMAESLRDQLNRVSSYVKLLADRIEKDGYGG